MLAKKAALMKPGTVLAGWLVTAARLAAKSAQRGELRRKRREAKVAMNSNAEQSVDEPQSTSAIDGELDDALARLNDQDRAAVTLRYLQNRPIREVAIELGISEEAATKRISRAVVKLRDIFTRRGIQLTPAVLVAALAAQADASAALSLTAHAVASSALQAVSQSSVASAAAVIAREALVASVWKPIGAIAAALLLLLTVTGIGWAAYQATQKSQRQTVSVGNASVNERPTFAVSIQPAPVKAPPIKVGVVVSLNTVNHKSTDVARNWDQLKVTSELISDPTIELYPLIEPGTRDNAEQNEHLSRLFPNRTPIDVTDAAALRQMDVIVASTICFPQPGALDAIESAVQNGTGLVIRQCLGGDGNGYAKPVVRRLRGVSEAEPDALLARHPSATRVLVQHELLGALSTKAAFRSYAYGAYGKLADGMTPLLQVDNPDGTVFELSKQPLQPHEGYGVYPLSIGQLGKGRIVSCAYAGDAVPVELTAATGGNFGVRLVRWAAGRPVEQ